MANLLILLTLPENVRAQYCDRIQAKFPELTINVVDHRSKVGPYIGSADILLTFGPMMSDEVLHGADKLKWIQAMGTGVDNLIDLPSLRGDVMLTSMHGIHGAPVSEAALSAMLALSRGTARSIRSQDEHKWDRPTPTLLHNKTVGIFGVGVIAEALAPKCKAFGMRVIGISSGVRDIAGFDRVVHRNDLATIVGELDYFVLLTPYSAETKNIVDAKVLAAMKPTSFLINLARGGVVDEPALIEVLQNNKIAGAALDVFVQEPLPPEHPFWAMKNVMVTAHLGGFCDVYVDLAMPIIEHNIRCFLAGRPAEMINFINR